MNPEPAPGPGRDEDPARHAREPDGAPGDGAPQDGAPQDGTGSWRLLTSGPDWMDDTEWAASLAALESEDEPADPDLDEDPDHAPPPGLDDAQVAALIAGAREASADEARAAAHAARLGQTGAMAAIAATLGRRGPGQPGSAHRFPGEYRGPAAGFATGAPLDAAPGCLALMGFAEDAAGDDDTYAGASDDELIGALCAWDRVEAHAAARKNAAVAELIRRRPAPGCVPEGPARMPAGWDEFTDDELSHVLAESRWAADRMLDLVWDLEVKLPGTKAAFRSGVLRQDKVAIIARATAVLDPAEARAAEALVLGRAGRLTPGGLRSAIARAVMQVAPDKARKRREEGMKDARVERRPEDSGNAALAGRELPPAAVLAADQRITWWARELRKAGLAGSMDELRARAFLDFMLGQDSRTDQPAGTGKDRKHRRPCATKESVGGDGQDSQDSQDGPGGGDRQDGPGDGGDGLDGPRDGGDGLDGPRDGGDGLDGPRDGGDGQDGPPGPGNGGGSDPGDPEGPGAPPAAGPLAGVIPAGFAGRVNLTVPLATVLGLAERPGEIPGIGPVDPALARDLAAATAANPRTTWCLTVTDERGYAIGHGCARPEPGIRRDDSAGRGKPGPPGGPDPPGGPASTPGPGFSVRALGEHGPPGGYGSWRLSTGVPGQPALVIAIDPVAIQACDHRFEAAGHDPGVKLRHLSQVRHATCTAPTCRRPATQTDFEHNIPYEAGGRTCLCNGGPKCRHDHRLKQHPRWKVDQPTPGTVRWTTPSGRQYTTEPTRYPI